MSDITCAGDDLTNKHLDVIAWCLERFFGHSEESAAQTTKRYYIAHKHIHDDPLYQHEGPYWMALRIHFAEDLGSPGDFHIWRVKSGYHDVPKEAGEHYYRHCFGNDGEKAS